MLRRYGLRFANEKKKCSVSIDTLQLNTTPLFSHLLNTSLSIYTLLRSHSWLIWSKQPLMSPSSIHCGKQSLLNHLWSASIASAVLLNFLNPYEFASASLSVISSKAIRYILHGSVLHGWYSQRSCLAICFGYVDLPQREGLISSPFNKHIASIFLASVSHFIWSTPAVRLPLLEVTFLIANALAS